MIWWWFDGDLKGFSSDLWWFNGDWFPDDLDSAPPGHVVVQTSPRRAPSSQEISQIPMTGFTRLQRQ